jgi:hypothetical protein
MKNFYQLGRNPHDPSRVARCAQAHDILNLSSLPARPAARDWSQRGGVDTAYQMFGNDRLGDCVIASLLDEFLTWSGQTGADFQPSEQDALDGYQKFGGWDPSNSAATDNGCVMLDVVSRIVKEPLAGQTIRAFVHVDPKNLELMAAALEFFGGLWLGWDLPLAWQGADVWGVSPAGSTSGAWAPRSWGGHATHAPLWSPGMGGLITWCAHQPFELEALPAYCSEAYALVSDHLWAVLQSSRCPAGVDVQRLVDLMQVVGSR